jgi:phage terminase large subunit-like protein
MFAERMLSAGNQQGKSQAGAAEMAYHLTGEYPDDWLGRRWDRPIKAWACGESALVVRDVQQSKLCGEPGLDEAFGSGLIPKAAFVGKPSMARGITDAYDTIHVRHKSGGISVLKFKSYEQGRAKFQGAPIDLIWADEEPPMDVYTEMLARLTATNGSIYTTFTPMNGVTELWQRFDEDHKDRKRTAMTIRDALHIDTPEKLAKVLERYPVYEHAARINGQPMMGEGRVFITPEETIMEPTMTYIPPAWTKLFSIDFGIAVDHAFGCTLQAWDRDNDVIHILEAWKIVGQTPVQHAVRMKQIGVMVPVAWPQDGTAREKSGEVVSKLYKNQGLKMLDEHATFEQGGYGTEAGVLEMDERMKTGRLKVAAHLSDWLEQYRFYHRKNGLIVKKNDDIMSATRIGVMAKRFGKAVQLGGLSPSRRRQQFAEGVDFDFDPFWNNNCAWR